MVGLLINDFEHVYSNWSQQVSSTSGDVHDHKRYMNFESSGSTSNMSIDFEVPKRTMKTRWINNNVVINNNHY